MARAPRDGMARWAEVPDCWDEELSDDNLRDLAGDTVFERGAAYFSEGRVRLARDGGGNTTFEASGTQTYATELYFEDLGLHVDCTCPHGRDGHFCKHMVAAAMVWRAHLGGETAEAAALPKKARSAQADKAARTRAKRLDDLQAFLRSQSAAALAERLWTWAERDRELMADLKAWAAATAASDDPKALKAALDAILKHSRGFLDWQGSNAYAVRGQKALPLIEQALARDPVQARLACEHALKRLYRVAEHADDSGGMVGELMQSVVALLARAVAAAPAPAAWADTLYDLIEDDPWGVWGEDQLLVPAGPAVAQRWSKVLAQRWERLAQALAGGDKSQVVSWGSGGPRTEAHYERSSLRRRRLADFERQGDLAALIDFARRSAQDDGEWAEAVRLCETHGRFREALDIARAAHQRSPDGWQVEQALLRCYERDGWDDEAYALRKARYVRHLRIDEWAPLLAAAQAAKQDAAELRREVEALLIERETKRPPLPGRRGTQGAQGAQGVDASLRVQWLLAEGRVADALAAVRAPNSCGSGLLVALATRLGAEHDTEAFALLDGVARDEIGRSSGRYDQAVDLVGRACRRLPAGSVAAYLTRLHGEFKAKRNFVKALDGLRVGLREEAGR